MCVEFVCETHSGVRTAVPHGVKPAVQGVAHALCNIDPRLHVHQPKMVLASKVHIVAKPHGCVSRNRDMAYLRGCHAGFLILHE